MLFRDLVSRSNPDQSAISDSDVKDRLLFSAVHESLRQLEAGVPLSAAEANIALLKAIGAPVWTGGYIQFVNTYGLQRFLERSVALANRFGERFAAPTMIKEKLKAGTLFT